MRLLLPQDVCDTKFLCFLQKPMKPKWQSTSLHVYVCLSCLYFL